MVRVLPLCALALLAVAATPQKGLPRGEDVGQYRTWKCITPKAIDMSPQLSVLCVGPPSWDSPPNPHVPKLFKIYVNPIGEKAMTSAAAIPFPVGTIIVKEKFSAAEPYKHDWKERTLPPGAKPELLTVMTKQSKGFDTPNGDWEYKVLDGDAKRENTKGLEHCAKCHQRAAGRDYVYFRYATKPSPTGRFDHMQLKPTN